MAFREASSSEDLRGLSMYLARLTGPSRPASFRPGSARKRLRGWSCPPRLCHQKNAESLNPSSTRTFLDADLARPERFSGWARPSTFNLIYFDTSTALKIGGRRVPLYRACRQAKDVL